jgi:extradiol dioxygenase family protein
VEPILHLSLPVTDLDDAARFYVDVLGCRPGRVRGGWLDVWFYGLQLTLQERPDQVLDAEHVGVRHFGVTLDVAALRALTERISAHDVDWVNRLTIEHAGTPHEQLKAKLRDPGGNVIELKAYPDPAKALENPVLIER